MALLIVMWINKLRYSSSLYFPFNLVLKSLMKLSYFRYARADAAKRLLDAKADANAQDSTGRTPLHAAVAADAQGVFQVRNEDQSFY